MFAFIGMGGMVLLIVGIVMLIFGFFKKNDGLKKKAFIAAGCGLAMFVGALALDPTPAKPVTSKPEEKTVAKVEEKTAKKDEAKTVKKEEAKVEKKAEGAKNKTNFDFATKQLKEDIKATESLVQDIHVAVNEDKKEITFSIVVNAAVKDSYVIDLIDTVLRKYNMFCGKGGSNKEKWGALYDEYSIMVGVATPATVNNPDKWLVYEAVKPEVQTRHKFKVKR